MMRSSYSNDDVEILLKDISGIVEPLPASVREQFIQKGTHYCEMLPLEYRPSELYMQAYKAALNNYSQETAKAVGILAEKLYEKKGDALTIVSLARAGIPIGILLKRYLNNKYGIKVSHYAISIIRGRGIDHNAMKYILHRHSAGSIQFIDGWIGKGAINKQLKEALMDYPDIDPELGVISDPANITQLCGTHEDILIPSSCLNATVTGLISRTFLRTDIIRETDFHGAAFYEDLKSEDLSNDFLNTIEQYFNYSASSVDCSGSDDVMKGSDVVSAISNHYRVENVNFIKPGIGEATRVLLRRIPWRIIINSNYVNSPELSHIIQLAKEKDVICEQSPVNLGNYKVCGIIKNLSDV